jgi:hypothetical protein
MKIICQKNVHRGKNYNMKLIHIVREKWIYRKQRWHGHGNKALEFYYSTTLGLVQNYGPIFITNDEL